MSTTDRLQGLAQAMRSHGLEVGTSETITAAQAIEVLGLDDRRTLREALAATMVRSADGRPTFDQLFDLWFPATPHARSTDLSGADLDTLRDELTRALAAQDEQRIDEIAVATLESLGRVSPDDESRGWSSGQALDALAPQRLIAQAQQIARGDAGEGDGSGAGSGGFGEGSGEFTDRIDRDEMRTQVAHFKRRVEAEARRRNTAVRPRERIARYGVEAPSEQRDFLALSTSDLDQLKRQLDPLARKLAAKLSRRRRAARGGIDVRRTLRSAMATGGVPLDPVYRRRKRHRPDVLLIADMSGSVGGFSSFTMLLMQALGEQFRHVRMLGFVSSTADITDIVKNAPPGVALTSWALQEAALTSRGRSSSYGTAFADVLEKYSDWIGHRTTVLVLGDGRTNYGDPGLEALAQIARRSRTTVWLNPERAGSWSTGDSAAREYAEVVSMHECRNAAQLRLFVERHLA
ncbi:VWA domain-containing protein [Yimella sp. cx-51]|uniref:VWA domain-containing protein n=1 Tax=Yimella sp. cx-51 TaxID=2770551 RepID=UPI001FCBC63B|nr:VWA domain-containing protein [Yimella sp. cx-51]